MEKHVLQAVMAYQPQTIEAGWGLLEYLKNIKSHEGKLKAMARLSSAIQRLRTEGLPPADSYCLTRVTATSPADLDLKYALLVAMITKAYTKRELNGNDTAAIGQESVLAECTRARFLPEGGFPLTLEAKLNSA